MAIGDIENQTGVDRSQLYRLLNRCAQTHDDGRVFVLKESELREGPGYQPAQELWNVAVRSCGYIQSRQAVGAELATASA